MIAWLCLALLAAPKGEIASYEGLVRVTRGVKPVVSVKHEAGAVRLSGDLAGELQKLQSFTVSVAGRMDGDVLEVREYSILDIGGGNRPMVGKLVEASEGAFALRDGEGSAIPLSLSSASTRRLKDKAGAKLWVYGKMLASGEVRVRRFGILRSPQEQEQTQKEASVKD